MAWRGRIPDALQGALSELQAVLDAVDPESIEQACALIARSGAIVGCAGGREGLMMRALVMRLHHLELRASMHGDMSAPPPGVADLLLRSVGAGDISTRAALMGRAREVGAECFT